MPSSPRPSSGCWAPALSSRPHPGPRPGRRCPRPRLVAVAGASGCSRCSAPWSWRPWWGEEYTPTRPRYAGFTQAQLTGACGYVYAHSGTYSSEQACLSAAAKAGYRAKYSLLQVSQLTGACKGLVKLEDRNDAGAGLFQLQLISELAKGGPDVVLYTVTKNGQQGALLPRGCNQVLNGWYRYDP